MHSKISLLRLRLVVYEGSTRCPELRHSAVTSDGRARKRDGQKSEQRDENAVEFEQPVAVICGRGSV